MMPAPPIINSVKEFRVMFLDGGKNTEILLLQLPLPI
jgi:hypothetical protein